MNIHLRPTPLALLAALSALVAGCYDLRPRGDQRAPDDSAVYEAATIDEASASDGASLADVTDAMSAMDAIAMTADGARADAAWDAERDGALDVGPEARVDVAGEARADAAYDAFDAGPRVCAMGFERLGETCVAVGAAPRPISPISLGDVTRRRPTLRWELPLGMDGAVLDLCRDRACTVLIESLRVAGTSALPTAQLPTRTAVYWRLRGTSGSATSARQSATWMFHVGASSVTTGVDTSSNPHLDCNGDGFDDLVVAAPTASLAGRVAAGTVSVFLGSATGIAATPTQVLEGASAGDHFGDAVSNAGDVNGDGYADLLVGSSLAAVTVGGETRTGAGRAQIFHGGPTGLSAAPALTINGVSMDENFGHGLATAGDVDADGYADVVIAAPLSTTARGSAGVYHGRASGLSPTPAVVLTGVESYNQFGLTVAHAGDVNGDGFSDVAIALPLAPYASPSTGQVRVYFGAAVGIRASSSILLAGLAHADRFGRALAGAVDVNNDGYSDLVVGAFRADVAAQTDAGSAYVFHGRAMGIDTVPASTLTLPAPAAGDAFGYAVASLGDSNGDGFGDIAVAAHNADPGGRSDAGLIAIYQGSASGITSLTRAIEGAASGDWLGAGLGFVGDLNADGYGDLGAGSPNNAAGGRVSVFHGGASGIEPTAVRTLSASASGEGFGSFIAARPVSNRPRRCALSVPSLTRSSARP